MKTGDPIILHQPVYGRLELPTLDPRGNAASALAAYLRCLSFRISGGESTPVDFQLTEVLEEWPDASVSLPYPCASLVDASDVTMEASDFVPRAIEDSFVPDDQDATQGHLLWKLGEATGAFQLDFWLNTIPAREAVAAQLGGVFNLGEDRSGLLLVGDPRYFCAPVRATLQAYRRADNAGSVYPDERRLTCRVTWQVDSLDLRCGSVFSPIIKSDVIEPGAEED